VVTAYLQKKKPTFQYFLGHQIAGFELLEHLWDELYGRVQERQATSQSLQQLVVALQAEGANIPQQVIRNLTSSLEKRCQAVIYPRSGHTR
jgi:hypothetical protein